MDELYPLRLEPQVKELVWGGRWLAEELGRPGNPKATLGESWEAYSGSIVMNGPWSGLTLDDLFHRYGENLLGRVVNSYPKFPVLVKFIDAHQNLSVQVHPENALAQELENYPFGKTEFWYVLKAEPDAELYYGLSSEARDTEQLAEAIKKQDLPRYLQRVPIKAGDVLYLPAGTVHALTQGIVVYELQQDCDITYRLYDWGRVGRQLHIEKGLKSVNFEYRNLPVTHPEFERVDGHEQASLVSSPYFTANLLRIKERADFRAAPDSFTLLTALAGSGTLTSPGNKFAPLDLKKGDTILLPATLDYALSTSGGEPLKVIAAWLVENSQ